MASGLRSLGLPIGPVVTMESSGKGGAREALKQIQGADKVKGQRSHHKHKIQRTIDHDVIDIQNTFMS